MTEIQIAFEAIKQYAQMTPRPTQVYQNQAAEMLGVSKPTLAKMIKSGDIKLNKCGMIHISEIDKAIASQA